MDLNLMNTQENNFNSSEKEHYKISNDQEITIENSRTEIKNGDFHKNEDVISEMRELLKKK